MASRRAAMEAGVRIVTALVAEARPLVRRFGLEPSPPGGAGSRFRRFRGDDLELIVSGVGSTASAAAVADLGGGAGRRPRGWLNVGIAGHRDLPLGSPRLASKIVEASSGRAWYPPAVFEPPCAGGTVCTVDDVEREFDGDACYEMEAAGFYAAALRCATAEAIQVLKVVSDNRDASPERLTAAAVEELIEANLPVVEKLVEEIGAVGRALERRTAPPAGLDELRERWHFTVTQERQLERLLRRLAALGRPATPEVLAGAASAAAVLAELRRRI